MERPLAAPLFSLILGLSLAGIHGFFLPAFLLLPLLALTFAAIFCKSRIPFILSISFLLFVCGNLSLKPFVLPPLPPGHIANFLSEEPVIIEGVIDSRPEAGERGSRLYVQAEKIFREREYAAVEGRLLLYIGEGRIEFLTGDRVRFSSRIQRPRSYGLPGEFDYPERLAYEKVYVTGFVKNPAGVILMRERVDYRLQRGIDSIAARIGSFIDKTVSPSESGILRALLIGDKGQISPAVKDAYSRTGVNHILAISGFHVGIIALFTFQLMMWTARRSEFLLLRLNLRRFILLLTLPLLVFYLFLSGAAPSTSRSVIMICFYTLALLLEREVDPVHSLMVAAACILALSPPDLFSISFQLSFLALWGLVVLTPLFLAPFRKMREGLIRKLLLFVAASAAAISATTFPVAYYFHRVSATGLISNLFIVPLMGYGAVVLGFSAIPFIPAAPVIAKPLMIAAAFLVKISNTIIMFLARIPMLPPINPSRFDLLLFYLFLSALTLVGNRRARSACCVLLVLVWAGLQLPTSQDQGKLVINVLSVGQGESTLITFPNGKRMLVDGGGSLRHDGPDLGQRLLAPALWKMGVRKIDYMMLSHPHPDHMQGLKYVAANFKVGEFWEGSQIKSEDYLELRRILAEHRIPVREMDFRSQQIVEGDVRIEPLAPLAHPPSASPQDDIDLNDESLVFRLVCGKFSMLFTGDIGVETEEGLVHARAPLKCTILKVPHHGSRYSSSLPFLAASAPEIAVISAGYHNTFHLPAQETLDNLRRRQIRVYRTDLDGTIRIVCDANGENLSVEKVGNHFY